MSATEYVVLVDQENQPTGLAEKITAHQKNLLHRAFSVFIFRQPSQADKNTMNQLKDRELLLQQRAADKYHCPLLWTNTCCSHPRQYEDIVDAGKRRLREELGIICELQDIGWFHYNAHFSNGLSENEIDHVLLGEVAAEASIIINPQEVQAWRWITLEKLKQELILNPSHYTPWLRLALEKVEKYFQS